MKFDLKKKKNFFLTNWKIFIIFTNDLYELQSPTTNPKDMLSYSRYYEVLSNVNNTLKK